MDQKYNRLSIESRSSIDDDQLLEKRRMLETDDPSSSTTIWTQLRPLIFATTVLLGLFLVVFVPLLRLQDTENRLMSPIPDMPTEILTFENYTDFFSPPTPKNDMLWMNLLGPGMGFISVNHPSLYDLPPGNRHSVLPPDTEIFGISMYHQLHCLIMIRKVYWGLLRDKTDYNSEDLPEDVHHTNHCFDYLRQSIMCAGDMSIEGKAPGLRPDGRPHVDGMGQKHQCKSFEASRAYMDAHRPRPSNKIRAR